MTRGSDLIDGALGDGSQFHVAFGYYTDGVGPETAQAPAGWHERPVGRDVPSRPGSEGTIVAWCLEVHDLVLSKWYQQANLITRSACAARAIRMR
ncbi:MAG: hypothetical protein ACRDMX_02295 [Solirubrobacteraceae bacterium]